MNDTTQNQKDQTDKIFTINVNLTKIKKYALIGFGCTTAVVAGSVLLKKASENVDAETLEDGLQTVAESVTD